MYSGKEWRENSQKKEREKSKIRDDFCAPVETGVDHFLERRVTELNVVLAESKRALREEKVRSATDLHEQAQEYREKMRTEKLHNKHCEDVLGLKYEEKLRKEVGRVQTDARLVIDFVRRKAKEAVEECDDRKELEKKAPQKKIESRMNGSIIVA